MSFLANLKQTRGGRIFITLLKIILCIIVGLFILWQYLIWPNYWDDKTIEDSDLLPVVGALADDENNAATFIPIQNNRTELEQSILDTDASFKEGKFYFGDEVISGAKLQQFISESRPLVEKFNTAASKTVYQCPLSFGKYLIETELCDLSALRQISSLAVFHAHYHMSIGNSDRATLLTRSVLKYGQLVVEQETPATLIEYLVGLALYGGGLSVVETYPAIQNNLQSELKTYLISDVSSGRVIQTEYAMLKDSILQGLAGQNEGEQKRISEATYFLRPNETVNDFADVMRMNLVITSTACNLVPDATQADALIEKYRNSLSIVGVLKPNVIGRTLLGVILSGLSQVRTKRCDINAQIEALSSN